MTDRKLIHEERMNTIQKRSKTNVDSINVSYCKYVELCRIKEIVGSVVHRFSAQQNDGKVNGFRPAKYFIMEVYLSEYHALTLIVPVILRKRVSTASVSPELVKFIKSHSIGCNNLTANTYLLKY